MKISMLQTVPGSVDGIAVSLYHAGTEYDLSATPGAVDLAEAFVAAGLAEAFAAGAPTDSAVKVDRDTAVPVDAPVKRAAQKHK